MEAVKPPPGIGTAEDDGGAKPIQSLSAMAAGLPEGAAIAVLTGTASQTERKLIDVWLAHEKAAMTRAVVVNVIDGDGVKADAAIAALSAGTLVCPVRISWRPRERDGERRARLGDMFRDPWRPPPYLQDRIARNEPDRWSVVAGTPATIQDLKSRHATAAEGSSFGAFVLRQATLALERAERSIIGDRYKVSREAIDEIKASAEFQRAVDDIAKSTRKKPRRIVDEALRYLKEMATDHSRYAIDVLFGQIGGFFARAYDVQVDARRMADLKALNKHYGLVFLPTHKSYLDPILMGRTLHAQGFPANHLLGGINLAFWPMGAIARRAGIVFIRRSFKDNPVYKMSLRQYMAFLVKKRFNLEWYIEGGRSRSGKLRPPRYGLLSYIIDGFRQSGIEDVFLVPASIAFDQLAEIGAMVEESRGGKKKAESLGWLLRYARSQRRVRSKAWLSFGEPLSLRAALTEVGADQPAATPKAAELAVQKTAFEICHRINRATPITPTALVTMALLGVEDRALTIGEIEKILVPLVAYVKRRNLPLTADVTASGEHSVAATLNLLKREGVVKVFSEGIEPVYAIDAGQHLVAAYYRNTAIHFFVNRAITEILVVRASEQETFDPAKSFKAALSLRDLLKFEFFFPTKRAFAGELEEELAIFDKDWTLTAQNIGEAFGNFKRSSLFIAHRVLRSFFEAYQVVADLLAAHDPAKPIDEKSFLNRALGVANQYRLQQRLFSGESVSKELFGNALQLAATRNLIKPGTPDLAARRADFAAEIAETIRRINVIRDLAMRDTALLPVPKKPAS